jgi:glucosylceramidase
MKIGRREFIAASSSALLVTKIAQADNSSPTVTSIGVAGDPSRIPARSAIYTTARDAKERMAETSMSAFKSVGQPIESQTYVFVDRKKTFQTFIGVGGAITDASAETFSKLPKNKQQELLKAYYDPKEGIGYTLARTNIHSCDFSSGSYTYVTEGDKELKSFSVEHDKQHRIPLIKQAMAASGGKLQVFSSPWSPPAFMKDNNDMLHGGKLKPEFFQAWANYYAKFIKAYQAEGIPIWATTVQNEPMATQKWESCIFTAEAERDFVKNFLGPTLKREGLASIKIIAWDHNRDLIYQRVSTILSDPEAAKYVWGIGFHWYEPWSGGEMMFDNVDLVSKAYPDKPLIFTEGCADSYDSSKMNDWTMGERYGYSMINDLNTGTVGWTDWNILLDEKGGPNHVGNYCFAPVHADTATGELTYVNSFHYIGHFSKFIKPGAKRIACSPSRSSISSTAFVNPDGSTAVVVMNRGEKPVTYFIWEDGNASETVIAPRGIQTLIY